MTDRAREMAEEILRACVEKQPEYYSSTSEHEGWYKESVGRFAALLRSYAAEVLDEMALYCESEGCTAELEDGEDVLNAGFKRGVGAAALDLRARAKAEREGR